jgi:type I restriction enzyme R subunit
MSINNTKDLLERYGFQKVFKNYLIKKCGFEEGNTNDYNMLYAVDESKLFTFLKNSQPKEYAKVSNRPNFKSDFIKYLRAEIKERGLLDVLRGNPENNDSGEIKWFGAHFKLMYSKPSTTINETENKRYESNILSVTEELVYRKITDEKSGEENEVGRGDLTLFINGLPIIWIELKANSSGQSIANAERQFMYTRDPDELVFTFKQGCLVYFAIDLEEVAFTTRLKRTDTVFMPYNKGVNMHKGNPDVKDDIKTSYMWNEILTKDNIIEWLSSYIVDEKTTDKDIHGVFKTSEKIIFPRYHQFHEVSNVLADVKNKGVSGQNYLIKDSPGSGKTYSIAWLAHHLASLHKDNKPIYDSVIVVTDRLVVDDQLQKAILRIPHTEGCVEVMDEDCTSEQLAGALNSSTKIIVSSIQKFSFILEKVKPLKDCKFAIIIDECHSSTKGAYITNAKKALSQSEASLEDAKNEDKDDQDSINDAIEDDIASSGKQMNITFFGYSATPKRKTLELFGTKLPTLNNGKAEFVPFAEYSMQQAIEEEFILDVLTNYTTYDTYFKINKIIHDNPEFEKTRTQRAIYRYAMLHPTNIAQKIEIIVEHFIEHVAWRLDGTAKGMVITDSREGAVRYKLAFDKYIAEHHIENMKALVAFTGSLKLNDNDQTVYSEAILNKFPESETKDRFNTIDYQVLLVANKYQTGYDQPLLCAMYVDKVLKGINAVQTLGRLNRKIPNKDQVFVLDFRNSYEDIKTAFAPYYTSTYLVGETDPNQIYKLERTIDSYHLTNDYDLNSFIRLTIKDKRTDAEKQAWYSLLSKATSVYNAIGKDEEKDKLRKTIKKFVEGYSWIIQVTVFNDEELHKKSIFYRYLLKYISSNEVPPVIDVSSLVEIKKVRQKKTADHEGNPNVKANPEIKAGSLTSAGAKHEDIMVRIDELIREMNELFNAGFDQTQSPNILQLLKILLSDDDVKLKASNNKPEDFALYLKKKIENVLLKGQNASDDFYDKVLDNDDLESKLVDFLATELYSKVRDEDKGDK